MILKILKLHSPKGSCNFENFQNHSYLLITNCTRGCTISYTNFTPLKSINFIRNLIHCTCIFNFQCVGLQPNSDPPTWVIGSNLHVHLVEGVATRLHESLSPYAVLGSELAPLPIISIKGLHFITHCIHTCCLSSYSPYGAGLSNKPN